MSSVNTSKLVSSQFIIIIIIIIITKDLTCRQLTEANTATHNMKGQFKQQDQETKN